MVRKQQSTTRLYDTDASTTAQRRAVRSGEIPVAVYGLGKMGLPLAAVLADATQNVTGVDIDPAVVEALSAGDCPVDGEPGLAEIVRETTSAGQFRATTDSRAAAESAQVHVVLVPTLIDEEKKPDLSALQAAIEDVSSGLSAGDMVIVESTLPPKTCREYVTPTLADGSGLAPDAFGVAFCPERTASGQAIQDIRGTYPKVVGGKDAESTRVAKLLYEEVTTNEVVPVSDCLTAECVKLFEGLYRDVNIAFANEIAKLGEEFGVDVNEAITVANAPEYCNIHSPGPGVGGHCIPYYPQFVIHSTDQDMRLLKTARAVNDSMPAYTVSVLEDKLNDRGISLSEAAVGLLGITYRAGIDETRASPTYPIASILSDLGTTVYAADPVCTDTGDLAAERVTIDVLPALDLDAVVVVTADEAFRTVGWDEMSEVVVLDGRGLFQDGELPHPTYRLGDGSRNESSVEHGGITKQ